VSDFELVFDHCVMNREVRERYRPLLNLQFSVGPNTFYWPMLVDTGADDIVLPGDAMLLLGIDPSGVEESTANTYQGTTAAFRGPLMEISFPDPDPSRSFEAPVLFAPRLDSLGYGLLGREPTLEHVRFGFTHASGQVFFVGF
jgi:hypothetical protein